MLRRFSIVMILLSIAGGLQSDVTTTHGSLKLIHARATPTQQKVRIDIQEPVNDAVIQGSDVTIKFRVSNWPLQPDGNHLHFILDNEPFRTHSSTDPFVFQDVKPGPHTVRVFPVHAWHESVKQQEALGIVQFYVQEKSGAFPIDPSKPMLIYSTPAGEVDANGFPGQPHPGVLVDWFLHNVSIGSKAGYYARISVDGEVLMSMKEWRPHYVQGLKPGKHVVKLELTKNDVPVEENWSSTQRTLRFADFEPAVFLSKDGEQAGEDKHRPDVVVAIRSFPENQEGQHGCNYRFGQQCGVHRVSLQVADRKIQQPVSKNSRADGHEKNQEQVAFCRQRNA